MGVNVYCSHIINAVTEHMSTNALSKVEMPHVLFFNASIRILYFKQISYLVEWMIIKHLSSGLHLVNLYLEGPAISRGVVLKITRLAVTLWMAHKWKRCDHLIFSVMIAIFWFKIITFLKHIEYKTLMTFDCMLIFLSTF